VAFKARTKPDTGHEPEPGDDPPAWEVHEFDTEAERDAFIRGINLANEATNGWTEGWLEVEAT
jgi:hypothetical protein